MYKNKLFLTLASAFSLGVMILSPFQAQAQSATVNLYDGQRVRLSFTYHNFSTDLPDLALYTITLGPNLEYVPGSITDTYGNSTPKCVTDNGTVSVGGNQTTINYRPLSSTTTTAPCGGVSSVGPAEIVPDPTADPTMPSTWDSSKSGTISLVAIFRLNGAASVGGTVPNVASGNLLLDTSNSNTFINVSVQPVPVPPAPTPTPPTPTPPAPIPTATALPRTGGPALIIAGVVLASGLATGAIYAGTRAKKFKINTRN